MKVIYKILLFSICSLSFAQSYEQAIDKVRFLIEHHKQQTQIPGVQVAVWVKDTLVWSESFGVRDMEKQLPVDHQTRFRIASVSKSLTSLALAKMMQDKRIDIDKSIRTYLPEFPKKTYPITSRQLASSTSGIRHYTYQDPTYNTINYPDVLSALEKFQKDPLLFEPGTAYHYSSYGWVLLSAVMEKASGQSFFEIMENTWTDLGMHHTVFDYPFEKLDNTSKFYIYDKKESRIEAPQENRSFMYAGGGYLSTAEDLVKAGQAILYKRDIDQKYIDELLSSQKLKNGSQTHYGLGWEIGTSRLNTPIVYHSGSMSTARSHLMIYPEEDVVFAYLSNTGDHVFFNAREAQNIAELFVEAKRRTESQGTNPEVLIGEWEISTTSLRDHKSKGTLQLYKNENGSISGEIEFKRSRKIEQYPVVVTEIKNNQAHLVGVSPMFMDFYLNMDKDSFTGIWLHDFNVKGIPEKDEYWKPRLIEGLRL
jgi:CubicO group peptidase (beta-lactamase class C family)